MALESSNLFRLPFFGIGGGLSTEFGAWLPKGSKAIFVRSTGVQSQDEQSFARKILPTLASGLLECRPSRPAATPRRPAFEAFGVGGEPTQVGLAPSLPRFQPPG